MRLTINPAASEVARLLRCKPRGLDVANDDRDRHAGTEYPRASNRLSARLRVDRVVPSSAASCPWLRPITTSATPGLSPLSRPSEQPGREPSRDVEPNRGRVPRVTGADHRRPGCAATHRRPLARGAAAPGRSSGGRGGR